MRNIDFGGGAGREARSFVWSMFGLATIGLAAGCQPADQRGDGYRGMVLTTRVEKPDFTFTATDGKPFDFRAETDGYVTLLFFGYTHCPDICPVHLANLGEVLRTQAVEVATRIKVVFVTTDPDRDSLPVIRRWLDNFDHHFVGLRAPLTAVNPVLASLLLPMARVDTMPDGTVAVAHPAAIVAFTRDNTLRVLYPFGVRQADWAHDLPRLVRDTGLAAAVDGNVEVMQSVIVAPAGDGAAVVYATVRNRGGAADSLLGCASPAAATCTLHEQVKSGGAVTMRSVPSVTLLAGGEVRLVPGGLHAMLERPRRLLPGDTAPVTWRFARYGDVTAPAAVVSYGDLERVLGSGDR